MPSNFVVGQVVRLKSGGPKMTVELVSPAIGGAAPKVRCIWFDGVKKFHDIFPPDTLEIAAPGQIGRAVPDDD